MPNSGSAQPTVISIEQLGSIDVQQAAALFDQGKEAVVFALLAMAKQLAQACPDCGGKLNLCSETRTRYIEDLPETETAYALALAVLWFSVV